MMWTKRLTIVQITTVFKSGEKCDMSNYRGITVGPVFAKLFTMIIERRLASWAEEHGVKARGQAGFRKNYRTTDNIFVLRSLIDKQKQAKQKGGSGKLYCCFVDFKKAFDTVPRALLWQVLEDLGVQGRVWDIIKSMYAHDSAAVRTSAGISEIFRCLMGVKQGCPLNPTLFGLYVDGLEKHLLETAGIDAPELGGILAPLLLYVDDLILMSTSPEELQQLDALANFEEFCEQRQLTVNLSKTKIVIFEARMSFCREFAFSGTTVERHDEYRYLGFVFDATKNFCAFRRSRAQARSNPGTGDRGGRCAAYIYSFQAKHIYIVSRQSLYLLELILPSVISRPISDSTTATHAMWG